MLKHLRFLFIICFIATITAGFNEKASSQPGQNLALMATARQSSVAVINHEPSKYNDGAICGGLRPCYGQVTTTMSPDPNAWIEFDWGLNTVLFDEITVYVNNKLNRALAGALIQIWNGSVWIDWARYNHASLTSLSYTVKFNAAFTTKMRLNYLYVIGNPNPATEEIEIRYTGMYHNDAGIVAFSTPHPHISPGVTSVKATIMNMGLDTLKTAGLRWSVDGNLQAPSAWSGKLVTLNTDSNLTLGTYNFTTGVRILKAWTVNPNGKKDSNNFNDTFRTSIYACNPVSGTFIIDKNGTGDFRTFNEAVDFLNTCTVGGTVKIRVKPGTYNEQVTINKIPGSSAINTITFESFSEDSTSVILTYLPSDYYFSWALALKGTHHIIFRKMTIQTTGNSCGIAVNILGGSDSNTISNNILSVPEGQNNLFKVVLFNDWQDSFLTTDNYNTISNNLILGGLWGIGCQTFPTSKMDKGNIIEGNILTGFYNYGIYSINQSGLIISKNDIKNDSFSGINYGIYLKQGKKITISNNNLRIKATNLYCIYSAKIDTLTIINNHIEGYSSYDIYGFYEENNSFSVFASNTIITKSLSGSINNFGIKSGGTALVSKIYNNMISCTSYSAYNAIQTVGIGVTSSVEIMNNTFNAYGGSKNNSYALFVSCSPGSKATIENNIMTDYNGGYVFIVNYSGATFVSDYNDLYSTDTNIVTCNLNNYYHSLSAYQTATGNDLHSINADPVYLSMTNLHVNTAAVSNKGIPVSYVTTDIDGDLRSSTTPDIGADEFNLANNDAGISDITYSLAVCPGINMITVRLKNYGINVLTSVRGNWSVNGILQSPTIFSSSLPQYKDTVVKMGSYFFNSGTKYVLKFWTTLPNGSADMNSRNDTFYYTIKNTALNGIYTIGTSGCDYPTINSALYDLVLRGVCSPVKFRIKPGSYNENLIIPRIFGASTINTITFESFTLDSTSVDINYSSGIYTNNFIIKFNNSSYININKIKLRFTGNNQGVLINLNGSCSSINITNNILSMPAGYSAGYYSGSFEAINRSDSGLEIDIVIKNNLITGGSTAISMNPWPYTKLSSGIVIQNNTFKDFSVTGISLSYQYAPLISGNYFENSVNSTTNVTGIGLGNIYDSAKVIKNKIIVHGISAIHGISFSTNNKYTGTPALIANNFISVSGSSTSNDYGIQVGTLCFLNIYNNSVNVETKSTNGYALYIDGNNNGCKVFNNILVNTGGGYAYCVITTKVISNSNFNDLYVTGSTNLGYWNGTSCPNLVAWKAAATPEINSISANPMFYSSSDLHVTAKAIDSAGTPLPSITDDMDGDLRNPVHPDIGADEFQFYNYDASVVSLISPLSPCAGLSNTVSVKIKNVGLKTINTADLKWIINGVPMTALHFIGNLLPFKDTILTLGNYTFNLGVHYSIRVWVDTLNGNLDQQLNNDTLKITDFHARMSGNYTIGTSGKDYKTFKDAVNDLIYYGICSPVTFLADPGIYNENIVIPNISGTSKINTITFQAGNNDSNSVVLTWSASLISNDNYVILLDGANWIRLDKLTITATSTAGHADVIVLQNAASNNIVRNCILQSSKYYVFGDQSVISTPSNYLPCNYNLFDNNIILQGLMAISFSGSPTYGNGKGNAFRNNKISGFYNCGIYCMDEDSIEISGNTIISYQNNGLAGIALYYFNSACNIINNQIYLSSPSAMDGISLNRGIASPAAYAMIANNFISLIGSSTSATDYGIDDEYGYCHKIYHNSINITKGSNTTTANIFLNSRASGTSGKIEVENNILVNTGGGYAYYVDTSSVRTGYLAKSNFNNIYTTGGNIGKYGVNFPSNLAAWRATTGRDSNSMSHLPPFTSNIDLHLSAYDSLLIVHNNLGIATDIDGELRGITPTVGADEHPLYTDDAGVSGIINPPEFFCEGIFPLTLKLNNYGASELDSVFIDYMVNGFVKRSMYWKGSLNSLSSTVVYFGTDTFSTNEQTIKFRTRLPNGHQDPVSTNDADSMDLKIYKFPVIKTTTGDTVCKGNSAMIKVSSLNTKKFEWWDSITGGSLLSIDSTFIINPLNSDLTYYVDAATPGIPLNLTTSATISSTEMGNMFDVSTTLNDVTIDSFAIHCSAVKGKNVPIAVYYKTGSYAGSEKNPAAWKLLGIKTVVSNGNVLFTNVNTGSILLKKSQTYGFYISSTDPASLLNYTNGANVYSDANVRISAGTKSKYPFDTGFVSDKTWNGTIFYETGSLCSSARVAVAAIAKPVPKVKLGNDTAFCKGGVLAINAVSGLGYSYDWRYGAGTKSISTKQSIAVDSGGIYRVIVSALNCKATDTLNLTVYPRPSAKIGVNKDTQCLRSNLFKFSNFSTIKSGSISSQSWSFGDAGNSTAKNPGYSYTTDGTYNVSLIVTSDKGCRDTIAHKMVVNPNPMADFSVNDSSQCVQYDTFVFTNHSSIKSGSVSFIWKLGDGTNLTSNNCKHSYVKTGSYSVLLIATSGKSCMDTAYQFIHLRPNPIVNLGRDTTLYSGQSIVLDAGSGYDNYIWSTGSSKETIKVDSSGSGHKPKKIWVTAIKDGCTTSDTIVISFRVVTGIQTGEMKFLLYPNPAQTFINIEVYELQLKTTVQILDAQGKPLSSTILEPQAGIIVKNIDITSLAKGIYFVRLINDYGIKNQMLIKN